MTQRPADGVKAARENIHARIGKEALVVVIGDSVDPGSDGYAVAGPVDIRSVQLTSGAGS